MRQEAITLQFVMLEPPDQAMRTWLFDRTQWMAQGRFFPIGQTHDTLTYRRQDDRSLLGILLFGLLAFRKRTEDILSLRFAPHGDRYALVTVAGTAEPRSAKSLVDLATEYNEVASNAFAAQETSSTGS
jgi:hypothetical protein